MRASIVIPTYNRADRLAHLLRCLIQQEFSDFEVLVCDDGSSDHTRAVAEAVAGELAITYLYQPDAGFRAGQARNLGIAAARGEIVICVDDDTLLAPDFVAAHVQLHKEASNPTLAIGLRFRTDVFAGLPHSAGQIGTFEPDIRIGQIGQNETQLLKVHPPWRLVYSCNLSAPRNATELRFSDSFHEWGIEDHEFGYRMLRSGLRLELALGAPVLHVDDPTPRDPFLMETRQGQADYGSYIRNLLRFFDLHGSDPDVCAFVREQLQWFMFDWQSRRWWHTGRRHHPDLVIAMARQVLLEADTRVALS